MSGYKKLYILPVMMVMLLTIGVTAFAHFYITGNLRDTQTRQATLTAQVAASTLEALPALPTGAPLRVLADRISMHAGARVTIIDWDGRVLTDTGLPQYAVPDMDNHANRPEVLAAAATGLGIATRYSDTLGVEYLYIAIPYTAGRDTGMFRLSFDNSGMVQSIQYQRNVFVLIVVLTIMTIGGIGLLAAHFLSMRLAKEQLNLEQARNEALRASSAKSEFLAAIGHELRTPMTGIIGFADLLMDEPLPDNCQQKAARIKSSADGLLTIVNDILDMSKLETGDFDIEPVDFVLRDLICETSELRCRSRKTDMPVSLNVVLADDLPVAMRQDPTRIRQVLSNLLENAHKFTDKGSITVRGELRHRQGQDMICISVTDTGIGIAPQNMATLFQAFTQADASISRQYEGTGLGLAISKQLVERMGGQIGVESEEGVGSTFWFELPYIKPEIEPKPPVAPPCNADIGNVRALHVLIAEDNRVNQLLISTFMKKLGHSTHVVDNGVKAVEAVRTDDYDLVLMDIRMPEMDGIEATRAIRQLPCDKADIPIIAVTADVMQDQIAQYQRTGMNGFVAKPVDRVLLAMAINDAFKDEIHTVTDLDAA